MVNLHQRDLTEAHNREELPMTVKYLEQPYELIDKPLWWHKQGLQQTASGYGRKLTSHRVARLSNGREYRVYITQISNAGSAWITLKGEKLFLRV